MTATKDSERFASMSYSVSDVARATGLKTRTIQFWADKGVMRASAVTTDAGKGTHRSFSADELIVACLVHPMSLGLKGNQVRSIGELKEISKTLRSLVKGPATKDYFEQVIAGNDTCFLTLIWIVGHGLQTFIQSKKEGNSEIAKILGDLEKAPGRAETICLNRWIQGLKV
jgi:DNA-binding transcriptional MerR regulator